MTKDLVEILGAVEKATGPDKALDVAIECALGPWRPWSLNGGMVVPEGEPDYWGFTDEQADAFIAAYPKLQDRYARIPEFGTKFYTDPANPAGLYGQGFASIHKNKNRRTVAPYTSSIDAALALVEKMLPGWGHQVGRPIQTHVSGYYASVFMDGEFFNDWMPAKKGQLRPRDSYRPNGALAIIAALLKALIEKEAENGNT